MKCVQLKNGLVKKFHEKTAREIVNSGKGVFVPKHVYKHEYGVKDAKSGKIVDYICKDPSCTVCK